MNKVYKKLINYLTIMGYKMKQFAIFAILTAALLFGCSPDASVTAPDNSIKQTAKLIKLPAVKSGLAIEADLTKYKNINGDNGGTFSETFEFQSVNGPVTISSTLVFPANSFAGSKTISQKFNTETASLEFGPAMVFNTPVEYTLTVSGLNLTGVNPDSLDFVYVAQNGSITGVVYDYINANISTGSLTVNDALLEHFSRYGFVNKDDGDE